MKIDSRKLESTTHG